MSDDVDTIILNMDKDKLTELEIEKINKVQDITPTLKKKVLNIKKDNKYTLSS